MRTAKLFTNALDRFLAPLEVLPFDHIAGRLYGRVRAELQKKGKVIVPLDLMIGSHALSIGATFVTNNVCAFKRIRGLKIENWTTAG